MRVKAVLFDKDGTLFDFQKTWSGWVSAVIASNSGGDAVFGARMATALGYDLTNGQFVRDSLVVSSTAPEIAKILLPFFPEHTLQNLTIKLDQQAANVVQIPVLPLGSFLDELIGMQLKTGIATNDSEFSARAHLEKQDIAGKFDYIAGYDSGFGAKPDPAMCMAFATSIGVEPDQIAMVGDSLHDLQAGRSAGMQCVGVLTGIATAEDLAPYADVVLPDIGHLPGWIAN